MNFMLFEGFCIAPGIDLSVCNFDQIKNGLHTNLIQTNKQITEYLED